MNRRPIIVPSFSIPNNSAATADSKAASTPAAKQKDSQKKKAPPKSTPKQDKVLTRRSAKAANIQVPSLYPINEEKEGKTILKTSSSSPTKNPSNNPRNASNTIIPVSVAIKAVDRKFKEQQAESLADKESTKMRGQFSDVDKPPKFKDRIKKDDKGNVVGKELAIGGDIVIRTADGSEHEVTYFSRKLKKCFLRIWSKFFLFSFITFPKGILRKKNGRRDDCRNS